MKISKVLFPAVIVIIIALIVQPIFADRGIERKSRLTVSGTGSKRVALVVGNGAYRNSPLKNPVNDAESVAETLEDLNFEVILATDQNKDGLYKAVRQFGTHLRKAEVGLFFYAGHGIQCKGINYLLPMDADIQDEDEIEYLAFDANQVLSKMESAGNSVNIMILDACRNNPYSRSWRSVKTGLAPMRAPEGTKIIYATRPGKVAADGKNNNSPFTQSLIREMKKPGLELEHLIKKVAISVRNATNKKQSVWQEGVILNDFYFASSSGTVIYQPQTPVVQAVKPEMEYGEVTVRANVTGAQVWLDGNKMGNAPLRISKLAARSHNIRVTKDGYEDYTKDLEIKPGEKAKFRAYLKKIDQGPARSFTNNFEMKFVYIEPGTFMMGSPEDEPGRYDWEKLHKVTLTSGYYMQTTEITQGQWKAVMGSNPSHFKNCGDDCPVEMVSWDDVQKFIKKLNRMDSGNKYRLPTEAEWEYACRAGTSTAVYTGSLKILGDRNAPALDEIAWYGGNSGVNYKGGYDSSGWGEKQYSSEKSGIHPVGLKEPNAWGLYDMIGNVWEWCSDWYGDYPISAVIDPQGLSEGQARGVRGGGWRGTAAYCRSANRINYSPGGRSSNLGFRLVLSPQVSN
ncbi:SUMF1/EgtB/PvdO family nonheme iron enzyme [Desulfobacterales bacterium HSG16]|nr:SUMF1/EgtB/PvdO family nonheme iron enzyme [Desulfobacterales bacterium HSG16]